MSSILERYEELKLRESMSRVYDYPSACNELSCILRGAYSKVPKNVQCLMFQDTLAAFRLLPEVGTRSGLSAANVLVQAVEMALPKQKKMLAVTEFKHAVVVQKRRCKIQGDEEGSVQLPQDVLVHIFSFLDVCSLVSAASVCWSWSMASTENKLWESQYGVYFGSSESNKHISKEVNGQSSIFYQKNEAVDQVTCINWREEFKRAYTGKFAQRFRSNRGYCEQCKSMVWLNNMKCSNLHHLKHDIRKIRLVSAQQVIEYLLEDSLLMSSSSDSDSDSDGGSVSKLWAFPTNVGGRRKNSVV